MASVKTTGAELGGDVKRRNVPVVDAGGNIQAILVPEVDDKKDRKPVCSHNKIVWTDKD